MAQGQVLGRDGASNPENPTLPTLRGYSYQSQAHPLTPVKYPVFPLCSIAWLASCWLLPKDFYWHCPVSLLKITYMILYFLISLPGMRHSLCKASWPQLFSSLSSPLFRTLLSAAIWVCWESNMDPLQEPPVLLINDPSFQPLGFSLRQSHYLRRPCWLLTWGKSSALASRELRLQAWAAVPSLISEAGNQVSYSLVI